MAQATWRPVQFWHSTTKLDGRLCEAHGTRRGVVLGGGAGGGFDTPASGLYARLGPALADAGISTLWVKYRDPHDLDEAAVDVLSGCRYLVSAGIAQLGLVGHSFGGAVMVRAALQLDLVQTVVALAPQTRGTEQVQALAPRSLLVMHGLEDQIVPHVCSESLHQRAMGLATLELLDGAGHGLDESSELVFEKVRGWLEERLPR